MSKTEAVPATAAERGKVAPAKLAHCVLRTSLERVPEMVAWYRTVLEAEAMFENPFACFLTYDDEHHRIAIIGLPNLPERPTDVRGVDHVAFTYASLGDLVTTYERLAGAGITPGACIHHGPTLSMYYLDPDRNQIELQVDVFERAEDLAAFMRSGTFEKNPIGVVFDPAELAKRFREGAPEAELLAPLDGPPPPPDVFPPH